MIWARVIDDSGEYYEAVFGPRRWRVRPLHGSPRNTDRWIAGWSPVRGHREWINLSETALRCVGGLLRTSGKRPRQAWFRSADAAKFAVEKREEDEDEMRRKRKTHEETSA